MSAQSDSEDSAKAESQASDQAIEEFRRALEGNLGIFFTPGNDIQVLKNGVEIFPAMTRAVREAEESIEFLTFIYWQGEVAEEFAEALAERARAGVNVRILLDAYGAKPIPKQLTQKMTEAGCDLRWFRPMLRWQIWKADNRTHRKVLICDDKIGFTGGVGVASEWEGDARGPGEWRETHLEVRGPAVHGLRGAFLANWASTGAPGFEASHNIHPTENQGKMLAQVVRATGSDSWNDMSTLMHEIIARARFELRITTPYFVPNKQVLRLLREAADRGVKVKILLPGPHHDMRVSQLAGQADFEELLEAGARIWRYLPTMLHAKVLTADRILGCVGSANFNQRSMRKDDELTLSALDGDFVSELNRHFDEDLESSQEITLEAWRDRGWLQKTQEKLSQLLRPQT